VNERGPSYACACGLAAANHREYVKQRDGAIRVTRDEGIRSDGSVHSMSIMRRHAHGCHRLHNQIALRLFSFVLDHRLHVREAHPPLSFRMNLAYEDEQRPRLDRAGRLRVQAGGADLRERGGRRVSAGPDERGGPGAGAGAQNRRRRPGPSARREARFLRESHAPPPAISVIAAASSASVTPNAAPPCRWI
jgi:hypothetical protein